MVRRGRLRKLGTEELVEVQHHGEGLRAKTEVCAHLLGNPPQRILQRSRATATSRRINHVTRRLTFETCSSGTGDLAAIAKAIRDKKMYRRHRPQHASRWSGRTGGGDHPRGLKQSRRAPHHLLDCGMARGMSRATPL